MRTGIDNEHRSGLIIREELGLAPAASDNEVIVALIGKVQNLEGKLNLLERAMERQWST
jgi:hypothetical protein